jgi:hypothetical protein
MPSKVSKVEQKRLLFLTRLKEHCIEHEITRLGQAAIYANIYYECQGNFSPDIEIQSNRRGHFQIDLRMQRLFTERYGEEGWASSDNQLAFFFQIPSDGIDWADYDELMRVLTLNRYSLQDAVKAVCKYYIKPEGDMDLERRCKLAQEFLEKWSP